MGKTRRINMALAAHRSLAILLYCSVILVMLMVVLGGYTRLTGSGLSMVDWSLYRDLLPPLNHSQWMSLFDQYKTSPEFMRVNFWMSLKDFKQIFWLEYLHRLAGRLIGLVFLGIVVFTFLRPALKAYRLPILAIFVLGAAQGAMGWYMVKSGLVTDPAVSPYRLTAHLILAFTAAACLAWLYMRLRCQLIDPRTTLQRHLGFPEAFWQTRAYLPCLAIACTIVFGGFVAGLKAGLMYNEFPLMGDHLIPEELRSAAVHFTSWVTNPAIVQFIHRFLASVTLAVCLFWAWGLRSQIPSARTTGAANTLARKAHTAIKLFTCTVVAQYLLGIATLLTTVNIHLAVAHQLNALLLVLSGLKVVFWSARSRIGM